MTELKPCPFCGHKARHWMIGSYNRNIVQCSWCRIRTNEYETKECAVKAWNRRINENMNIADEEAIRDEERLEGAYNESLND